MSDLVIVTIPATSGTPQHTIQMTIADHERWKARQDAAFRPKAPAGPTEPLIRVEVEPGVVLQLTSDDAQRWREHRDARRATETRAAIRAPQGLRIADGSGVVLASESPSTAGHLETMGLPWIAGEPRLAYAQTLIWDPAARLRIDLIPAGFHLITAFGWEVAVPIYSYDELARDIGGDAEREQTALVVRDLRVPVYDPRVLFLRACQGSETLLAAWATERTGGDDRLSFLRALYRTKPLVCALPTTWIAR